ncbi:P-loop NTPase fold protein [Vibrio rotiferianus]|uniref:KAP family P-loop NTPase fold protein n=1 Tax=Vibrio rotiferianus TaxID=190895 RepID=UPI003397CAF8
MPKHICDWSTEITIEGKCYPKDMLNRQKYANYLSNFLLSKVNQHRSSGTNNPRSSYVLNLNGAWGVGKTFFVKRWQQDLLQKHPVVYINAWEQDYSEDPLITIISSMVSQLRKQSNKDENDPIYKVTGYASALLKNAAPIISKALFKKTIGISLDELLEKSNLDNADNPLPDLSPVASKVVEQMIKEHEKKSLAISKLKEDVKGWIEAAKEEKNKSYPIFVFIDELDRCRPSYAVEMIEAVKHIFNVPGLVFVIATDTEQLQHSVKALYGEGFAAREYLKRFFDSCFDLPTAKTSNLIHSHCNTQMLSKQSLENSSIVLCPSYNFWQLETKDDYASDIGSFIESFGFSARTTIQIMDRTLNCIEQISVDKKNCLNFVYLLLLTCVKEKDLALYDLLLSNTMNQYIDYNGKKDKLINHLDNICNWGERHFLFCAAVNCDTSIRRVSLLSDKGKEYPIHIKELLRVSHDVYTDRDKIEETANNFRNIAERTDMITQEGLEVFTLGYLNALEQQDALTLEDYRELVDIGARLKSLE